LREEEDDQILERCLSVLCPSQILFPSEEVDNDNDIVEEEDSKEEG